MDVEIFASITPYGRALHEKLRPFGQLSDEEQEFALPLVLAQCLADTSEESGAIANELLRHLPGEPAEGAEAIRALWTLVQLWMGIFSPADKVIKELVTIGVTEHETPLLTAFLTKLFDQLYKNKLRFMGKIYSRGVLPVYSSIKTVIDVRAMFDPTSSTGIDEKTQREGPTVAAWLPVIIAKVKLESEEETTTFEFQCNERALDELVEDLAKTKSELSVVKARLSEVSGELEG